MRLVEKKTIWKCQVFLCYILASIPDLTDMVFLIYDSYVRKGMIMNNEMDLGPLFADSRFICIC
jgi:hypothetical protein